MTAERPEIMRGHLKECLADLDKRLCAQAPKGGKGAPVVRQPVADFCGVGLQTIRRWLNPRGETPTGEILCKLYCFLDMVGYRVIELERMPKVRRQILELIGFGLVAGNDVSSKLGYTQSSSLYQVLQNKAGTTEQRDQAMWELWKGMRKELEERKASVFGECQLKLIHQPSTLTSNKPAGAPAPTQKLNSDTVQPTVNAPFKAAVSMINNLSSFLDEGWLDNLSPAQREELCVHSKSILRLTVHLNDLSSRIIAHEDIKGGG